MNGIMFKLFKSFIVENFKYEAWSKVQDIYLDEVKESRDRNFFTLINLANDILRFDNKNTLSDFGRYCFKYLLNNSLLKGDELGDIFFYSDPILNLKVKRLEDDKDLAWEIDGEFRLSDSKLDEMKFGSFINGFVACDKHTISLDHLETSFDKKSSCKVTVFIDESVMA